MRCTATYMPTNILLVEDDPLVREAIKRTLEGNAIKVTAVCCIEDAKDSLSRDSFSAVVSDVEMPNGTGVDLHEWVVKQCPYFKEQVLLLLWGNAPRSRSVHQQIWVPLFQKTY